MNDLVIKSANIPAHIRERSQDTTLGKVNLTSSQGFNRLSFNKNLFTYIQAGLEPKRSGNDYCDCVIIHAADTEHRLLYEGVYDSNNPSRPICFSGNGKSPHDSSPQKQHPRSCQLCEKNQKGSGPNGTKACKYTYPVVLLPLGKDGEIIMSPFVANINASSLFGDSDEKSSRFNLIQFNTHLAAQKIPSSLIVTRMSFDIDGDTNSKVLFSFERFLEEDEIAAIELAVTDEEKFPLEAMVSVTQTIEVKNEEAPAAEKHEEEVAEEEVEEELEEEFEEEVVEAPPPKPKAKKKAVAKKKASAKPKTSKPVESVSEDEIEGAGLNFDV